MQRVAYVTLAVFIFTPLDDLLKGFVLCATIRAWRKFRMRGEL